MLNVNVLSDISFEYILINPNLLCSVKSSRNKHIMNIAAPRDIKLFRSIGNLRALVPNLTLVIRDTSRCLEIE